MWLWLYMDSMTITVLKHSIYPKVYSITDNVFIAAFQLDFEFPMRKSKKPQEAGMIEDKMFLINPISNSHMAVMHMNLNDGYNCKLLICTSDELNLYNYFKYTVFYNPFILTDLLKCYKIQHPKTFSPTYIYTNG